MFVDSNCSQRASSREVTQIMQNESTPDDGHPRRRGRRLHDRHQITELRPQSRPSSHWRRFRWNYLVSFRTLQKRHSHPTGWLFLPVNRRTRMERINASWPYNCPCCCSRRRAFSFAIFYTQEMLLAPPAEILTRVSRRLHFSPVGRLKTATERGFSSRNYPQCGPSARTI